MSENEKRPDSGIKISSDNKFLKWLDNFWYHYKWYVIIITFVLIVVGVCTAQLFNTDEPDIIIVTAGSAELSDNEVSQLEEIFGSVLPVDYNKDGKKDVLVKKYLIYSKEEILEEREANKQTGDDVETGHPYIDGYRNSSEKESYNKYMQTGDASICIVAPWIYEEMTDKQKLPLSEIYGENIPEGAIDAYAIRLGDTDIYKHYSVLNKNFSPDTLIFMQAPLYVEKTFNKKSNEKKMAFERDTMVSITSFVSDKPLTSEAPDALPVDSDEKYTVG